MQESSAVLAVVLKVEDAKTKMAFTMVFDFIVSLQSKIERLESETAQLRETVGKMNGGQSGGSSKGGFSIG